MRKLPVLLEHQLGNLRAIKQELVGQSQLRGKMRGARCTEGCWSCCMYPVWISLFEAVALYRFLYDRGRWTLAFEQALEDHAYSVWLLQPSVWMVATIRCPLLTEQNKCRGRTDTVDARPFLCRSLWSSNDPDDCHPHKRGVQNTLDRTDLLSQYLAAETRANKAHQLANYRWPIAVGLLTARSLLTNHLDWQTAQHVAWDLMAQIQRSRDPAQVVDPKDPA